MMTRKQNKLALASVFFLASVTIVNCNEETSNMKKNHSKEVRSAAVLMHVEPIVEFVLGKDYEQRVNIMGSGPKGLMRDGKLMVASGSMQSVFIYGDLTEKEIQSIHEKLFQQLKQVRDETYAPVVIKFYREEVWETSEDGASARRLEDEEELLNRFIFPEIE